MTKIFRNDLIYSISAALDYVEHELVNISPHHSKRVALLSAILGQHLNYPKEQLLNLAICGALHDNALSEYQQLKIAEGTKATPESFVDDLGLHCTIGEENISCLAFYPTVQGAILYHHENADGTGPFGKKAAETPIFAQLIHIADTIDAQFNLSERTDGKFQQVRDFVHDETGTLYDPAVAQAFLNCFTDPDNMYLDLATLDDRLHQVLPEIEIDYPPKEILRLADFFAKIIDYKSRFTFNHSSGVAQKAQQIAVYYGWDTEKQAQFYLSGALHDVGKLMTQTELLEKPGKLTDTEFVQIKEHAHGTYSVLRPIRGLEHIARWAYNHHEKLNGSGYPFGINGAELSKEERVMNCLDIYQALRENRPYHEGMSHEKAMAIFHSMADNKEVDEKIVQDIDHCFKDSPSVPMERVCV